MQQINCTGDRHDEQVEPDRRTPAAPAHGLFGVAPGFFLVARIRDGAALSACSD
jgi:hypothetical protein